MYVEWNQRERERERGDRDDLWSLRTAAALCMHAHSKCRNGCLFAVRKQSELWPAASTCAATQRQRGTVHWAYSLCSVRLQWRRQRSKGARSFRPQKIFPPVHPDALFSSKKLTTFFNCRPQNTGRRRFTVKIKQIKRSDIMVTFLFSVHTITEAKQYAELGRAVDLPARAFDPARPGVAPPLSAWLEAYKVHSSVASHVRSVPVLEIGSKLYLSRLRVICELGLLCQTFGVLFVHCKLCRHDR